MKKYTKFRPQIYSRHPTHNNLRTQLPLLPFKSIIRLGSITHKRDTIDNGGNRIEINTIDAVKNSANKLLMKQKFTEAGVKTADWWVKGNVDVAFHNKNNEDNTFMENLPYPIISKHIYGSRGTGNTKIDNLEQLNQWMQGKTLSNYIFEKFYSYSREYRLHITENGCFYSCRKMLKSDVPEENRWYRNDSNSVWILEDNEQFDKPINWDEIVSECVKALKAVKLDIGGFDVKVQSSFKSNGESRENPKFIIIESNSACSHGEITSEKYKIELPKILIKKYELLK